MNLQQLEHFLVLVEAQSFSRASERLHMTQPALSRSIQALEEALGGKLLERGKHKTLTPLGELAIVRARRIRVELAELHRSADLLAEFAGGTLRLGLGPSPTAILSMPLLRLMMRSHPGVKVLLSGGTPDMQLQALRAFSVDALVLHSNNVPPDHDLNVHLLPRTPLGFVCRAGHPLASGRPLRFDALRRYPIAASGRSMSAEVLRRLDDYFGAPVHFSEAVQYQSNDMAALVELVCSTDAVFFGVLQTARKQLDSGELVQIALAPRIEFSSQFVFVTLEGQSVPPALRLVRELCEKCMGG